MTPFEKLGYKVGDRFRVTHKGLEGWGLKGNSVVTFTEDDGTENPYFRDENGKMHCFFSDWIEPIDLKTEAEKRGAKFGVGGVVNNTSAVKRAIGKNISFVGVTQNSIKEEVWNCAIEGEDKLTGFLPSSIRLDHEPEYKEIPFIEATDEQRMEVGNLVYNGSETKVSDIKMFSNGTFGFTLDGMYSVLTSTNLLTVRVPA